MSTVLRIIDANANRAREALRVMEEAARFHLDDAPLTAAIKSLRHDLSRALSAVPALDANRDTPGDVGTAIMADGEHERASLAQVAVAAGKRLSEALRAIEEYGKTLSDDIAPGMAGFSQAIERLRYRGYDAEQRLNRAMGSGLGRQWRLCLLLTESLCVHNGWRDVLEAALDAGADCVQVREKQLDAGWLKRRVEDVIRLVAGRASVIVNDRPDVALLAGADGVHVGQTDLSVADVRRLVGRQLIVGVSTSNLEQAKRAVSDGADYCGVGPMFATTTKQKDVIVGPAYLRQYVEWGRLPHLAIGGISPENVGQLVDAGVRGVAVSGAVCAADDPEEAVRRLVRAVEAGADAAAR
jgi:thiamine-phosphate pyrophosphorylase